MQQLTNLSVEKKTIVNDKIKKLMISDVETNKKHYIFHRKDCGFNKKTPFKDRDYFYVRGKSSSDSIKYQCKKCKKITNVLPDNIDFTFYYQQQRGYLQDMLHMIIHNKTMNEICSKLKISNKTYYHKLELISNQLVQFQNKIESIYYENKELDSIYINSNIYENYALESKWKMIVSCDFLTSYIYRCDMEIKVKEINDFYISTAIPHYFMLSHNKNVASWFFLTPHHKLYNDYIKKSLMDKKVSTIMDEKDDQIIKFVEFLRQKISRFSSPYAYYYINILKVIYNFTYKSCLRDKVWITPAEMHNLTDRAYSISDLFE